jgi:ribose transport system ATP-binding protein
VAVIDARADGAPEVIAGAPPLLHLRAVSKWFPGVQALDGVDFDLYAGEVHVLFGENGAGKSTLINIVAGALRPDAGDILLRGQSVRFHSVHDARQRGISAVFQEFSLVPELTVEENLFLGAELTKGGFLNKPALHRRAEETLARLGFPLRPRTRVNRLSRAEQQMVEIAKALRGDLSILILDEPTAALTEHETARLFQLVQECTRQGVGIIYITHRMNEVHRIGDRITVLRDGRRVDTLSVSEASADKLVELMTGRKIEAFFPRIEHRPGDEWLAVEGLTVGDAVHGVSLTVRAGEIVGLAGLVGSGKSEVGRACFGVEPIDAGTIRFRGTPIAHPTPRAMLDAGLVYLPPDRRLEGLLLERSVRENIALAGLPLREFSGRLFLNRHRERSICARLAERLGIVPPRIERAVTFFSGGNQQKVMLAKGLTRRPKLFIMDEPTMGIDVGAKTEVYRFMKDLVEREGAGILLISSDLPEILHLTHRTYVMYRGRMRAELKGSEIAEQAILSNFFEPRTAAARG